MIFHESFHIQRALIFKKVMPNSGVDVSAYKDKRINAGRFPFEFTALNSFTQRSADQFQTLLNDVLVVERDDFLMLGAARDHVP